MFVLFNSDHWINFVASHWTRYITYTYHRSPCRPFQCKTRTKKSEFKKYFFAQRTKTLGNVASAYSSKNCLRARRGRQTGNPSSNRSLGSIVRPDDWWFCSENISIRCRKWNFCDKFLKSNNTQSNTVLPIYFLVFLIHDQTLKQT